MSVEVQAHDPKQAIFGLTIVNVTHALKFQSLFMARLCPASKRNHALEHCWEKGGGVHPVAAAGIMYPNWHFIHPQPATLRSPPVYKHVSTSYISKT